MLLALATACSVRPPDLPVILSFTASHTSVPLEGADVELSWEVEVKGEVMLETITGVEDGVSPVKRETRPVELSGSMIVRVDDETEFHLVAQDEAGLVASKRVKVTLEPFEVAGTLVDVKGRPLPGVEVQLNGGPVIVTDSEGRFRDEIDALPYSVYVHAVDSRAPAQIWMGLRTRTPTVSMPLDPDWTFGIQSYHVTGRWHGGGVTAPEGARPFTQVIGFGEHGSAVSEILVGDATGTFHGNLQMARPASERPFQLHVLQGYTETVEIRPGLSTELYTYQFAARAPDMMFVTGQEHDFGEVELQPAQTLSIRVEFPADGWFEQIRMQASFAPPGFAPLETFSQVHMTPRFKMTLPPIAGPSLRFQVLVTDANDGGASYGAALWSGQQELTFSLPTLPVRVSPARNAPLEGRFEWERDAPGPCVLNLTTGEYGSERVFVHTEARIVTVEELAAAGLPITTSGTWAVGCAEDFETLEAVMSDQQLYQATLLTNGGGWLSWFGHAEFEVP